MSDNDHDELTPSFRRRITESNDIDSLEELEDLEVSERESHLEDDDDPFESDELLGY